MGQMIYILKNAIFFFLFSFPCGVGKGIPNLYIFGGFLVDTELLDTRYYKGVDE